MSSATQARALLVGVVFLLLLASCTESRPMVMKQIDVGEGVTLSVPEGYAAARDGGGAIRVYLPSRENSRSPVNIVLLTAPQLPAPKDAKTKRAGRHEVHYVVVEEEGGSGGPALRLRAWTKSGARAVSLESVVQPDVGGDGEFRAEWAILAALP